MSNSAQVKIYKKTLTIPTYKTQKPEKNPLFLEKRVYQGSSGKVYPFPVTERVFDEKVNEDYDAVILENKYIQITFLPELGGRIYRALDKTNNYDFVYYNHVIKPALVGLTGSWISGGIEFNWPQHHRPDTFLPVEYSIKDNEDGSKTLWMSDIDRMYGTKVLVGFTMFPDKAYLKMKEVFSNPTDLPQTFLWWANPAVPVNEHTQSIFPPDVHAVFDHGKRAVSNFPIATGEYYKVDYSKGVDISRYKNVPVPTSFMAAHSDADFLGNYDYKKKAGLLHIADHHTSPGKKQWTWGNGNFGKSWDHQLTDNDGSYIELMVGTFTDNQPDFTWLAPHEEKSAIEYFMPYKGVGAVKNATIDAAVNLEKSDDVVNIKIYATGEFDDTTVTLWQGNKKLKEKTVNLNPQNVYTYSLKGVIGDVSSLLVDVRDAKGRLLVDYQPKKEEKRPIPEAAKVIASPVNLKTNDELYFAAIHLEQYRHASYWPEDYYLEGLKRDPLDFRINDAYGLLLYRRGLFEKSEKYFRAALKRQTEHNTNPESGSANYHLGLTLIKQDKFDMAYDAFYKATWSHDTQSVSFIEMAKIKLREKSLDQAIEFLDQALVTNGHDVITRALKIDALRKKDQIGEAQKVLKESLLIDSSSLMLQFESYLLDNITKKQVEAVFNHKLNNYLTITQIYIEISDFIAARNLLDIAPENPLKDYYLSFIYTQSGEKSAALIYAKKGEKGSPDYVFPNRLFDIIVLNSVRKTNPDDGLANYYLGNLFYDRKVYNCAINLWEKCTKLNPKYAMAYRNLPIAYFNKQSKSELALRMLEKAFELDTNNARLVFELDSLYKKLDYPVVKRLKFLQEHIDLVEQRDDSYVQLITLLNETGDYQQAYEKLMGHVFHPWEGGEGKVSTQYEYALVELAKKDIDQCRYQDAVDKLKKALSYPLNLGEGKLPITHDNIIDFYLGLAYKYLKIADESKKYFKLAIQGTGTPAAMIYYNDQPADNIFYQGLALEQLDQSDNAVAKYQTLIDYGKKHLLDKFTMDYFAVSLPDSLLFNEDYQKQNTIYCYYLMGLGYLGLNKDKQADVDFKQAIQLSNDQQGVIRHLHFSKPTVK